MHPIPVVSSSKHRRIEGFCQSNTLHEMMYEQN
jgi:hypothetical protein